MVPAKVLLKELLDKVKKNDRIRVGLSSEVRSIEQVDGKLSIEWVGEKGNGSIIASTVVLAMGSEPIDPSIVQEYGYGHLKEVVTPLELDRMLKGSREGPLGRLDGLNRIVFIQCVGSRSEREGVPYCSSICCTTAIRQAIALKELLPRAEVYVLYIDIRTNGRGQEALYKEARRHGVRFVRGQPSMVLPSQDGVPKVCGENTLIRELYELRADLVVLCTGLGPGRATRDLLKALQVPQDISGYPVTYILSSCTNLDGLFLAGSITGPKSVEDTLVHADACALQVNEHLIRKQAMTDERWAHEGPSAAALTIAGPHSLFESAC